MKPSLLSLLSFVFLFLIQPARSLALVETERETLRQMADWLPYVGCQESRVFKQCFTWMQEECETQTANVVLSCLNMYDSQYRDPRTGNLDAWKDKIVDCALRDLKAKLKGRQVDSMLCRNKGVYP